ncbi:3-oxoacyl-ACP reductase FabG [Microbacterium trichothecenolyticum]|uniref:3-oxoacyl-ACP reductase FabG n=1 Tax=Microbacterium ureisolvens TaxID=2781186 RepID=A0ABS7I0U4_9MICO|nr:MULTISPECIES: 3-oxoacyl-ACP reductase FabG [Microbacterium]MBW9110465.1 3-oxoacyl-ACP reductase FabG [Microbacterium ureisolvens]MBW9120570.1 3-oxoacyl-ACP reductase FabG [Microbacterium trichothecenolyticum]
MTTTPVRTALITGAARGIGSGIAGVLAARGYRVIVADVDEARATATAAALGDDHAGIGLDVTDRVAVDGAIEELVARYGQLDVVVNNAGINRDAMFHKMTDDQWSSVIDVDLSAVFYVSRAAGRHMRGAGQGRIINISSASWEGNIGQANYAAAKAGVLGLTFTLARELARFNVTANAICPGFIETDMTRGIPADIYDAQIAKIPLGRAGDPADVGHAVAYFASEEAAYITGQVLEVGGGYRI